MKKIRILFIVLSLLILAVSLVLLTSFNAPFDSRIGKISEFKITKISGKGAVYWSKRPLKERNLTAADAVDIKEMSHTEEMYLKTGSRTAFEFYCFGTAFIVLPGSHIYYQPKTKEFCFYCGEYFWNKEIKSRKVDITIANEGEDPVQKILTIPDAGRLKITSNSIEMWNYAGNLKFSYENQEFGVRANQMLVMRNRKAYVHDILHAPEFIAPEDKVITLTKPGDSFVRFSWRAVRGAKNYRLRIYSSALKENLLDDMILSTTRESINLQKFEANEFYWQVFPYDLENKREGSPSKIGYIKTIGSVEVTDNAVRPPRLVISSLTASGNMVLIRGEADKNGQLYINNRPVPINADGTFFETLTFKKIGTHTINLRLVAPDDRENDITRTISTFEE
ncbi:MAG: hypothetical protein KAW12_28330 [Candidatus Aminicenantes bacterium]|nr:hypothetical protein [Candidatus Aminicenantes bacterium]